MRLFLSALFLALRAIARNKTRAGLTVLGILIGVAAVVTVTALGTSATDQVGGQIDNFGANMIFVSSQPTQQSGARSKSTGRLTEADGRAISREAVSVSGIAPFLSTMGQIVYADKNVATTLYGVTATYFPIRKFKLAKGDLWTESDELLKTKVCVIGPTVAQNLFGTDDPIGRVIRVGKFPFRVAGLLEARGTSPFGEDQDDRVFMPIGSYRARVQHTAPGRVDMLIASATSENTSVRAQEQIDSILRQRHHIEAGREPDFQVNTQAEFRAKQQSITGMLTGLLFGVAAISLVVGGIGVMNIMLVSVAERTREIGIRMSIGARSRDILVQFLIEAVVLSLIGGVLGCVVGIGGTLGLAAWLDWHLVPSPLALAIAAGTSGLIGVSFGFLPARRAANLDPIEALRVE